MSVAKNWSRLYHSRDASLRAALGEFRRTLDDAPHVTPPLVPADHYGALGWLLSEACTLFDLPDARSLFAMVLERVDAEVGTTIDVDAPGRAATLVGLMELEICARNVMGITGRPMDVVECLARRLIARRTPPDRSLLLRAAWSALAAHAVEESIALVPQRPLGPLDGLPPRDPTTRLSYLRGYKEVPTPKLREWWSVLLDDAPQMIEDGVMGYPMFHAIGRAMRVRLAPFDPLPVKWIRETVAERIA
jgi:hypothetical protein